MNLDLDARAGWPEDLRILVDKYPREVWADHANLGQLARFWLDIHNGFRDLAGALDAKTGEFRNGLVQPEPFRLWFASRLRQLLTHLNAHHQIEDHQFFPVFSGAEPRLALGFDVLERDHEAIHETITRVVDTANAFLRAPLGDADAVHRGGDRYAEAGGALLKQLDRHLADEEDLIIPLILDRTEGALGI